jgi:hypothetical protein
MKSRSKLALTIGGIGAAALLAFCCGLLVTVQVIIPTMQDEAPLARATGMPTVEASPSVQVVPTTRRTPVPPSPTPTYSIIIPTPTPRGALSTPLASATATSEEQPSVTSQPTPTSTSSPYPFHYVNRSRVEELQCTQPYLQGWVRDATGAPLNGVTISWEYWNNTEYAVSGDHQFLWQPGEFKFTYYAQNPHTETDFVLQVVGSADNPVALSQPLVIHYAGCGTMGQITNIVFKQG